MKTKESNETEVILEIEAEISFKCQINYKLFPFHEATCKFKMTSFNEVNNSMLFITDKKHGEPGHHLQPVRGYTVDVRYLNVDETIVASRGGTHDFYSIVGLNIHLVSTYMKYVYIFFIPTSMFTFTSWVSFLLPPTSYPARTSLLVTVFLCQIGVFTAAINDTPDYDKGKTLKRLTIILIIIGMTKLEIWCFGNIACTFLSLLSYVIILIRMEITQYMTQKNKIQTKKNSKEKDYEMKREIGLEIFLFALVFGGFLVFNLIFWT